MEAITLQICRDRRFDSAALHERVLQHVMADGQVDKLEFLMLKGMRKLLVVTDEAHEASMKKRSK